MKKIILFLMFILASLFTVKATEYQIVKIWGGKCEIKIGNKWRIIEDKETISSSSIIRSIENDIVLIVQELGTEDKYRRSLQKGSSVQLGEYSNSAFSAFFHFLSQKPNPIRAKSAETGGSARRGNENCRIDPVGASLLAKMDNKFDVLKINSSMSDYDIFMNIIDIDNSTEKQITLYNISEHLLYVTIVEISPQDCRPIKNDFLGTEYLLKIASNNIITLPQDVEMNADCSYVLIACKNNFNVKELLYSINSDDCILDSDIPIGIYKIE